jgi:hypothetical protein
VRFTPFSASPPLPNPCAFSAESRDVSLPARSEVLAVPSCSRRGRHNCRTLLFSLSSRFLVAFPPRPSLFRAFSRFALFVQCIAHSRLVALHSCLSPSPLPSRLPSPPRFPPPAAAPSLLAARKTLGGCRCCSQASRVSYPVESLQSFDLTLSTVFPFSSFPSLCPIHSLPLSLFPSHTHRRQQHPLYSHTTARTTEQR